MCTTLPRRVMDLPDPAALEPRAVGADDGLAAHPKIKVICRRSAGACAETAGTGAPPALQVADRIRLGQKLTTAVEKTVAAHHSCLRELPPTTLEQETAWETPIAENSTQDDQDEDPTGRFAESLAHDALVHDLFAQGMGIRHIAGGVGVGHQQHLCQGAVPFWTT